MAFGFNSPFLTIGTFAFGFSSVDNIRESIFIGRWRAADTEAMESPKPRPRACGRSIGRRNIEAILKKDSKVTKVMGYYIVICFRNSTQSIHIKLTTKLTNDITREDKHPSASARA